MPLVEFNEIREFLDACLELMPLDEEYNSILFASGSQISEKNPLYQPPYCMLGIEDKSGKRIGVALYAEPDGLLLSQLPDDRINEVCTHINSSIGKPVRIMGADSAVTTAKEYWTTRSDGGDWSCSMLDVLRITKQELKPRSAPGELRAFRSRDEKSVRELSVKYEEENSIFINVEDYMMRRAGNGRLFLWDDNGIKAMLTLSVRVYGGVRISGVYTSHESRGKGYAGAAISTLLSQLFDDGINTVRLHASPDSVASRLYKNLGFQKLSKVMIVSPNDPAN